MPSKRRNSHQSATADNNLESFADKPTGDALATNESSENTTDGSSRRTSDGSTIAPCDSTTILLDQENMPSGNEGKIVKVCSFLFYFILLVE